MSQDHDDFTSAPSPIPIDRRKVAKARTINDPNQRLIPPILRELLLRTMDGNLQLGGLMQCLSRYRHRQAILLWLIHNRWVGKNLEIHLVQKFGSSVHGLVQHVIEQINRAHSGSRADASKAPWGPPPTA